MTEPNKGVQDGTNELDSILGDEVTPSSSQEQPEATADKAPQKSEEELEFAKLSGSTQDRIRQLIRERDDARKKAETPDKAPLQPTPTQTKTGELTAEQRDAIKQLKEMTGMVTKDELQAVKDNLVVERTYASLEEKYDGSNGLPKFSREEVEDHMRRTGIYNPEKAYKDMYEEEFFDYRMKQASKKEGAIHQWE